MADAPLNRDDVQKLQMFLKERGVDLIADGVPGPQTRSALELLMHDAGGQAIVASLPPKLNQLIGVILGLDATLFENPAAADLTKVLSTSFTPDTTSSEEPAPPWDPSTWTFYARSPNDESGWLSDLAPGHTIFWIHGRVPRGGAYKLRLRTHDTVLLLVGQAVVASGVLLADNGLTLVDDGGRIRRPVRVIDVYPTPLSRDEIESRTERRMVTQGSVHPLDPSTVSVVNDMRARMDRPPLPYGPDILTSPAMARPLVEDLKETPYILPDAATAAALNWPGPIWTPPATPLPPTPVENLADEEAEPETEDAEAGPKPPPDIDARIPFVLDAPSDSEDALDRGPFALFLAQRLHLIWCQMNGHAPGPDGQATRPAKPDTDTFIAHVDSPWGGGKTTFANFVARVLNPHEEVLTARHFLRSSLAPLTPEAELKDVPLQDAFVPPYAKADPAKWPGARRPWIVARYNAWRDQFVSPPPWWQVFLSIQASITGELWRQARVDLRAARVGAALRGLAAGAWIVLLRLWYQLGNSKLNSTVFLFLLTIASLVLAWWIGIFDLSAAPRRDASDPAVLSVDAVAKWIALAVTLIGVGGTTLNGFATQNPINRFRSAFDRILRVSHRPVLVIVDDIDRCDPDTVVEIMRGFQTIVRSPRLFVLLLGDRAWIETAHDAHHKELAGVRGVEAGLGALFVQKLIQLSFRLPTMKAEARARFAQAVLGGQIADATADKVADVLRRVDSRLTDVVAEDRSVGGVEAEVSLAKTEAKQALPETLSAEERKGAEALIDNLASVKIVAAAGSDAAQQRSVFNAVTRLVDSLPNNPRQIKRIFMAFATYEVVGRVYFDYQLTPSGPDGERLARRWRQLAMWVTLAVEWPDTWRAIARRPELLAVAYDGTKGRGKAEQELLARAGEAEGKVLAAVLARMRADPALLILLSRDPTATAAEGEFSRIEMEIDAIYEFNRIIWEPGFRLGPEAQG